MAQENKLLARNNKTDLRLFSKRQLRFPSAACLRRIVGGPGTTQKVRLGRSIAVHIRSPSPFSTKSIIPDGVIAIRFKPPSK